MLWLRKSSKEGMGYKSIRSEGWSSSRKSKVEGILGFKMSYDLGILCIYLWLTLDLVCNEPLVNLI